MGKKPKDNASKVADDQVMYGKEDPEDLFGISEMEAVRDDLARRARLMLDIPFPKGQIYDPEDEMVLMYLGSCMDYHVADTHLSGQGEYDHDAAVFDLNLLIQSANKVKRQVLQAKNVTTRRSRSKARVIEAVDIRPAEASPVDLARQFQQEIAKKDLGAVPEKFVIGKKGG